MRNLSIVVSVALASAVAAPALAQSIDFSGPITTGAKAPGVWYVDRHAPAGFQASGGQLVESISGADLQANSFYNTQGYSYDLDPGATNLSIDLTIDSSWASTNQRLAGMWGVGVDTNGDVSAYPIIEFTTDGGVARFHGYDVNTGDWTDLVPTGGIDFGSTYTLNIALTGGNFVYTVGDASWTVAAADSVAIKSVLLQGYNTGSSYDIHWDNLNASAATGAVPEPASWAMMLGGFGLVGGAMRRRKAAVRFA